MGVVLFGVNRSAHLLQAEARAAIETELGGVAPVFRNSIRHVEAAAFDTRSRGQPVYELDRAARSNSRRRRRKRSGGGEGEPESSADALAGDYQALAEEIFIHLLAAEEKEGVA